jgi:hypothetical protein
MPRKSASLDVANVVPAVVGKVVDLEKEQMRAELDELRATVAGLVRATKSVSKKQKSDIDISPNKYVNIMSLCRDKLNLSTESHGRGKCYEFENFGETHKIKFQDLEDIIREHRNFLENGYFYILDAEIVTMGGYDDLYSTLLSKEKFDQILSSDKTALPYFQDANSKQQKIVIDFFVERISKGEPVDLNFIAELSKASKEEIDILKQATEIKQNKEDLETAIAMEKNKKTK